MSQHKTILNLWLFFFSLILFLSVTGCATVTVNNYIHHPNISLEEEYFSPTNKQFTSGTYLGLEILKGQSYARIKIKSVTEGCTEGPSFIELLLPMEKNSNAKATFRPFNQSKNEQFPVEDKYAGQPVKIIFYSPSNDKDINIDKDMALMVSNYNWSGYPSVVIVGFTKGGSAINSLAYRISPETNNFLVCYFENNSSVGPGTCTKKKNSVAGIILTPFAVVLDIITFPAQMLAAVLTLCIGRGGP
jgi:hypothetical protein